MVDEITSVREKLIFLNNSKPEDPTPTIDRTIEMLNDAKMWLYSFNEQFPVETPNQTLKVLALLPEFLAVHSYRESVQAVNSLDDQSEVDGIMTLLLLMERTFDECKFYDLWKLHKKITKEIRTVETDIVMGDYYFKLLK